MDICTDGDVRPIGLVTSGGWAVSNEVGVVTHDEAPPAIATISALMSAQ
jgi:hypothetical protein